ncbi:hypothetical protein Tsubulata_029945 [Turnera subulata]|uniref:F-box domain-containing protein n=1 Tax=Turnera subulata TaxID=218843 RepID=A0A9Q0J0R0_9ROSI|nr:hypothetical protein Tsubulata_029945 [Turnera subulata]
MEQLEISTNMAATNSSCFPREIVEEILALLPITSIHRFRFLSKSWFSLLAIKFEVPTLLCCHRETKSSDPLTVLSNEQTLFNAVVLPDYSGDVKDTVLMVPELPGGIGSYAFVGSCNGLVCLRCTLKREIFVLNPFTGFCRKLPYVPFSSKKWHYYPYVYAFGYDSASDDYKVFLAGDGAKVEIFSLKTGSWKKVKNPDREYLQHILSLGGSGLFWNGALHWESNRGENTKIIAFHLGKEKFYDVPRPPNQISIYRRYYSLGVVGEYLCLCHSPREETNIVWVMKEYCNQASWVPFISYTSSSGYGKADGSLTYVCDFIPRSFKDGRYMLFQFAQEHIHHVLIRWNNNLEESDDAEKYSKKIKIYAYLQSAAIAYTETLSSPYAS